MSRTASRPPKNPVELFVSYSHHDSIWLDRLRPLLQFDKSREKAYPWNDQEMKTGDRWDKEIKAALDRMDVFVCLVTTEFLTSGYIRDIELPRAFEREKNGEIEIVPIVIYRNIRLEDECPGLRDFNPLPAWGKCWRDYKVQQGDYRDAHGLIRAGLRQAIEKVGKRRA